VAAILAAVQARAGTILLERLTDVSEAGTYAAAARFTEAGRVIPNAFFGALFPALAALATAPIEMNRLFGRVMLGLGLFGVDAVAAAAPTLTVTAWALLPGLLRSGRTLYWYARGREGFVNTVTAISLVIQIGLSLWLIPQSGAPGAAIVSVIVEIVALILVWR
jgi:O-antigen/teichoic acid export membrane protein